eukprot:5222671-Pyramimonas_sp.AAC.1
MWIRTCGKQTHTFAVAWFIIAPIMTEKSVPTLVPSGPQMLMHWASCATPPGEGRLLAAAG